MHLTIVLLDDGFTTQKEAYLAQVRIRSLHVLCRSIRLPRTTANDLAEVNWAVLAKHESIRYVQALSDAKLERTDAVTQNRSRLSPIMCRCRRNGCFR
jgi:hypothetical protein